MRTLDKNKTTMWIVNVLGDVEEIDSRGFYTGQVIKSYSTPVEVRLSLYPANGEVLEQLFGRDISADMLAVSNDVVLTKDTLLFLNENINDYSKYDYTVTGIAKSLNTIQYALRSRM